MTTRRALTSNSTAALAWAVLVLLIPAAPMLSLAGPAAAADGGGAAAEGEKIFTEQKCSTCHGLSSKGIEAKVPESSATYGGDLSGAVSADEIDELGPYLRGETEIDGATHKKKIKLGGAEMTALLEWLATQ